MKGTNGKRYWNDTDSVVRTTRTTDNSRQGSGVRSMFDLGGMASIENELDRGSDILCTLVWSLSISHGLLCDADCRFLHQLCGAYDITLENMLTLGPLLKGPYAARYVFRTPESRVARNCSLAPPSPCLEFVGEERIIGPSPVETGAALDTTKVQQDAGSCRLVSGSYSLFARISRAYTSKRWNGNVVGQASAQA